MAVDPMNWRRKLKRDEVVLLDGGTGSELRRRGVPISDVAWSGPAVLTHPAVVRDIHAAYVDAGAEVIIANTFATSRFLLKAAGFGEAFETANRRAVKLAQEAAQLGNARVAVAGSLSNLPPAMDIRRYPPAEEEADDLRSQAALLAHAGVDLIALEMLQDTHHAARALAAALATGLPVWLGVSARLVDGELRCFDFPERRFAEVLDALVAMRPDVVNIMHTELAAVAPAIDAVRERFDGPVGVYPETDPRERATPAVLDRFVACAEAWRRQGARLFGGCCGTTPKHIAALRAWLSETP